VKAQKIEDYKHKKGQSINYLSSDTDTDIEFELKYKFKDQDIPVYVPGLEQTNSGNYLEQTTSVEVSNVLNYNAGFHKKTNSSDVY
jgi:hypothetical protein